MTIRLPFNDRTQEASWVFINHKNIELNRLPPHEVAALPSSTQSVDLQSGSCRLQENQSVPTVASPPVSARTSRLNFGYQRSYFDVEYTRTNLG